MKKINYLMMAAAMVAGLASCSKVDNPSGGNEPVVEPTAQLIIKEINFGGGFKSTAG